MKKSFFNKTKKLTAIALGAALMLSMSGCGDDKDNTSETTAEATTEASSKVILDDENVTMEENNDKVILTTKNPNSLWYTETYETTVVDVEILEEAGICTFTITPKEEGFCSVDIIGETADAKSIYPINFEVDKDLNLTSTFYSPEIFELEADDSVEEVIIDEDLNEIITASIDAMGPGNYPDPYMARPIDITSTDDMLYVLGVENVNGLEKGAVVEPMMSSVAFSLAVLKFDTADNANNASSILYDAAPEEKWVCVLPEGVFTKIVDENYLIVFMGPQASIEGLK